MSHRSHASKLRTEANALFARADGAGRVGNLVLQRVLETDAFALTEQATQLEDIDAANVWSRRDRRST